VRQPGDWRYDDGMTFRAGDPHLTAVSVTTADLAVRLGEYCPAFDLDLAGAVALPAVLPHRDAWLAWIEREDHAGLEYLTRDPAARADPTRRDPWARSLLVFAQRYTDGWPADDPSPRDGMGNEGAWTDGLARYARGTDYHEVLRDAVDGVLAGLQRRWPDLAGHAYVDTGPFLEREYALLAGLGFTGKNTCFIHETLGSGLFLAVALTNLEIRDLPAAAQAAPLYAVVPRPAGPLDPRSATRCGTCTKCLDACPTGALREPFRLDANLCLSTWTIEWRGRAPAHQRHRQGALLFGCDICQAVCPWNRKAAKTAGDRTGPIGAYEVRDEYRDFDLADLLDPDPETFAARFRRTPLWRGHPDGLRRNALVAAAGSRRRELLPLVREVAVGDPDPEVREVAAWAAAVLAEEA
jgi:epoxyqueuosine reductase